nr:hypothetical protein [Tanacetum cinerariifolium]
ENQKIGEEKEIRYSWAKTIVQGWLSTRVESFKEASLDEEDASKQERKIANIDADKELTLIDETTKEQGRLNDQDKIMFDADKDLQGKEVIVEKAVADKEVNAASIATSVTVVATTAVSFDELTMA